MQKKSYSNPEYKNNVNKANDQPRLSVSTNVMILVSCEYTHCVGYSATTGL